VSERESFEEAANRVIMTSPEAVKVIVETFQCSPEMGLSYLAYGTTVSILAEATRQLTRIANALESRNAGH